MLVRKAQASDSSKIQEIEKDIQANPWSVSQISSEIDRNDIHSVVLFDPKSQEVAGYLLTRTNGNEIEIMNIGIASKHQRKGFASKILQNLLNTAQKGSAIFLEVSHLNIPALQLYQKLGFLEVNRRNRYYRDGSDAIIMRWKQ